MHARGRVSYLQMKNCTSKVDGEREPIITFDIKVNEYRVVVAGDDDAG